MSLEPNVQRLLNIRPVLFDGGFLSLVQAVSLMIGHVAGVDASLLTASQCANVMLVDAIT